jgi:hypothetical protein
LHELDRSHVEAQLYAELVCEAGIGQLQSGLRLHLISLLGPMIL